MSRMENLFLPTASFQHGSCRLQGCHAKIGYLDVIATIKKQVFGLQITMAMQQLMSTCVFVGGIIVEACYIPNKMMMTIVKSHNDMLEMTTCFILTKTSFAHKVFEKLATFNILENQVPVS